MSDDPRKGALVPEMNILLTEADSPLKVGDECIVRVAQPDSRHKDVHLSAKVLRILPGCELTYFVQPYNTSWGRRFVRFNDIARVSFDGIGSQQRSE